MKCELFSTLFFFVVADDLLNVARASHNRQLPRRPNLLLFPFSSNVSPMSLMCRVQKKWYVCNITIDEGWILFISISCLLHTVQSESGLKEEKTMWLVREWREKFYIIQNAFHIQHESFQLSPNRITTEIWSREMKNEILMAFFALLHCVCERRSLDVV